MSPAVLDYSQSGEQAVILEAVHGLPVGRFLDIGAGDGVTFSNTRALAQLGWGGVCVEPAAWAFDKLVELYADTFVQVCCAVVTGQRSGLMTFLYSRDDHLSTVEASEAAKWTSVPFKTTTVGAVTLEQLLDWFELRPSVVSIDAEGRTNEIMREFTRLPQWEDVKVICYERELPRHAGRLILTKPFEKVAETPNNLIYRRR